jgi:hypothetical protein
MLLGLQPPSQNAARKRRVAPPVGNSAEIPPAPESTDAIDPASRERVRLRDPLESSLLVSATAASTPPGHPLRFSAQIRDDLSQRS